MGPESEKGEGGSSEGQPLLVKFFKKIILNSLFPKAITLIYGALKLKLYFIRHKLFCEVN